MWDAVVAAHGEREALVSRHQGIRWTYAALDAQVERCARGLLALGVDRGDRVGIWSPNNAEWVVVQFATARVGAILVNINPSYRAHELEYALRQSGCSRADPRAPGSRTPTTSSCCEGVRRAGAARAHRPRRRPGTTLLARGDDVPVEAAPRARGRARVRRPDQHPVHVRHDRVPEGRDALAPQHPQQRLLHRRDAGLHAEPTASASRCRSTTASAWCSATSRSSPTAPASSIPAEAFDPLATLEAVAAERCTSLYGVPTMFIAELNASATSPSSTSPPCAPGSWPARRARSR